MKDSVPMIVTLGLFYNSRHWGECGESTWPHWMRSDEKERSVKRSDRVEKKCAKEQKSPILFKKSTMNGEKTVSGSFDPISFG